MRTNIHIKSACLAMALIFGCLVVAQQPAANPTAPPPPPPSPPTPAPSPAPTNCTLAKDKPSPSVQNYNLSYCIVAKLAGYIKINNSSYVHLEKGKVNETLSNCPSQGNQTVDPKLVIDFECGQLEFQITQKDGKVFVKSINGQYRVGSTAPVTFSNTSELFKTTQTDHYYKCNSEQAVVLNQNTPGQNANQTHQLVLSNFAYETYREQVKGTDFYKIAEECPLDSAPFSDGVRIGVGVCLIAFVAIILIAYFVGRRRWSQRSSYESV